MTARRLTAAAMTAAAVTAAVAVPASAADYRSHRSHRSHVEISRVRYDSSGQDIRSNRSLNKEWVDVTNDRRRSVNLDGWTLSDRAGHTYTFHHYRLAGRATVRIHTGIGRDSRTDLYQDRRAYVWNKHAGTAILHDDHGHFIDEVSWGHRRDGRH
jgi:hypothetical protein